ncbi:hypothetical protein GHT09_010048 [Marmota monax]|uniref:Uncharacterized protein n=1 Tax=Marmota monax TaxID=9995 RepID=A0A834PUS6_MARMO|nr:hypothetical protein GHT09_010048 [Marmota monax]
MSKSQPPRLRPWRPGTPRHCTCCLTPRVSDPAVSLDPTPHTVMGLHRNATSLFRHLPRAQLLWGISRQDNSVNYLDFLRALERSQLGRPQSRDQEGRLPINFSTLNPEEIVKNIQEAVESAQPALLQVGCESAWKLGSTTAPVTTCGGPPPPSCSCSGRPVHQDGMAHLSQGSTPSHSVKSCPTQPLEGCQGQSPVLSKCWGGSGEHRRRPAGRGGGSAEGQPRDWLYVGVVRTVTRAGVLRLRARRVVHSRQERKHHVHEMRQHLQRVPQEAGPPQMPTGQRELAIRSKLQGPGDLAPRMKGPQTLQSPDLHTTGGQRGPRKEPP